MKSLQDNLILKREIYLSNMMILLDAILDIGVFWKAMKCILKDYG
jgi:hypothetical protein